MIRIGNTGVSQHLPQLAASCAARARVEHARLLRAGLIAQAFAAIYAAPVLSRRTFARLLSIWSIADTTASKVSMVEAWRAL